MEGMTYEDFLALKKKTFGTHGIEVQIDSAHLFPFQKYTTELALKKGRFCIFAGTGTGKTRIQATYADHIEGVRLILAPLAVAGQTILEAQELGICISYASGPESIDSDGIYITNYDRFEKFEDVKIDAIILDESSIIKSHDGKFRNYLQERCKDIPFKMCLTATPAPNDYMELGTHAEFMGAMTRSEMLATYFTHDGGDTSKWRLKGHARRDFFEWVSTWALVFDHPSDIGFEQVGYDLPPLNVINHIVEVESDIGEGLFGDVTVNATNLHKILRDSAEDRAAKVLEVICEDPDEPWLVWVNTDAEQDAVLNLINGFQSVRGSDSQTHKEDRLLGFATGKYQRLITKPKIAGYGMNWQRCRNMIFCGVNYSFEQQYQAIRRCWRFGQDHPVNVHYITCSAQDKVMSAVQFKEKTAQSMKSEMKKVLQ